MSMKARDRESEFTLGDLPAEKVGETGRGVPSAHGTIRPTAAMLAVLALVVGAVALYMYWPRGATLSQQVASTPPESTPAPPVQPEPAIQHPVASIPVLAATDAGGAQFPLPRLDDSDIAARDALETILDGDTYVRLLVPDGIIRRIVATVDNLPRKTIAARILPTKPVSGSLATVSTARGLSIAGDNASRYAAYVNAAEAIDTRRLVGFYVRLYPLFQQAYLELGYPDGYFNDRLVNVIDHLLAAPEPQPPVYVSQPRILFEFVDPDLEALSTGQKILVRIGIGNELRLKAKLREIRSALTSR